MASQMGRYSRRLTGGDPGYPAGTKNGRIPKALLRQCATQTHLPALAGCLYPPAAIMVDRMVADARKDGVTLRAVALYRDYAGQQHMRKVWCARGNCNGAAPPGTSNHGWGTAGDWERHAPGTTGAVSWLMRNGTRYGWDSPVWAMDGLSLEEPWHWQWVAGFAPADPDIRWTLENGDTIFRLGERDTVLGGPITKYQTALREWSIQRTDVGLGDDLNPDGWYGPQTRDTTALFQRLAGILPKDPTMHGAAGPTTRATLGAATGIAV